jgi:hypothetical protein
MTRLAFPPRRPRVNLAAITSKETPDEDLSCHSTATVDPDSHSAVAAGGLALLLSGKDGAELRKGIGWSLFGVGATTYVLLVMDLLLRNRTSGA